jgi:lipopolysaccharide transport system ATP-binding protein
MIAPGGIVFRDVRKSFRVVRKATPRVAGWLMSKAFEHFRTEPFEVLRGVTLDIRPGELVGFLGRNGAGKSTLLKLVAGITDPDSGTVETSGRIASMLELGVGFHHELTGMENIFYSGALLGMSRQEVLQRLPQIIAFSGLEPFLHEAVRHYSSGMYARLACAVVLHLQPSIILMDEILAVGDAEFTDRALARVRELHASGVTILLVTHDAATAAKICTRMIWLDDGLIREDGPPADVLAHYTRHMLEMAESNGPFAQRRIPESGVARITETRVMNLVETPKPSAHLGQPFHLQVTVQGERSVEAKLILRWKRRDGRVLAEQATAARQLHPGKPAHFHWKSAAWHVLGPEVYAALALVDAGSGALLDRDDDALTLAVPGDYPDFGCLHTPPSSWSIVGT